jgi:hypothetical protein
MIDNQMIEAGARAIAQSQGHDPDDLAPRAMMCTADNQQVQWWHVFEEEAEACLADAAARIEALESLSRIDASVRAKFLNRIEALEAALRTIKDIGPSPDKSILLTQMRTIHKIARAALDKDAGI